MTDAPPPFGEALGAVEVMERMVLEADGLDGLVLRYGWFYGPGTYYAADGTLAADVRRRRFPVVGEGSGVFSFLHVDDAADATVVAVERGAPGIYNIVDDEPAPMRAWLPAYAQALGAKPPRRVPLWLARFVAGRLVAELSTTLPGASNAEGQARARLEPRPSELAHRLRAVAARLANRCVEQRQQERGREHHRHADRHQRARLDHVAQRADHEAEDQQTDEERRRDTELAPRVGAVPRVEEVGHREEKGGGQGAESILAHG